MAESKNWDVSQISERVDGVVNDVNDINSKISNVNNTSDANKPISTATQTALNAKYNSAGGTVSGNMYVNGAVTVVSSFTLSGTATFNSNLNMVGNLDVGGSVYTGPNFELGSKRTTNGHAWLDFHYVANNATDYDARIIRYDGAAGDFLFYNAGGASIIRSSSSVFINQTANDINYLFREGRLDIVNNANSAWQPFILRSYGTYIRDASGNNKIEVTPSTGMVSVSGALGIWGAVVVSDDNTVSRSRCANGYLEWLVRQPDGNLTTVGTNYFVSDEKLKENIEISTFNASAQIKQIQIYEYDWINITDNTRHVKAGFIAQQMKTVDESFIREMSDGTLSIHDPTLLPVVVKALKETMEELEDLKHQIAILKKYMRIED